MLIRFPSAHGAGTSTRIVEAMDLMPTIVEILGSELPSAVQGASLIPVIEGESTPPYVAFGESQVGEGQRFVALAGYRGVVTGADGAMALYHTAGDPLELDDVSSAEADKVAKLTGDMEAWTKMVTATSLDPELRTGAELDEETLKQLKSLGYVQ